jgi:hypothetical protein
MARSIRTMTGIFAAVVLVCATVVYWAVDPEALGEQLLQGIRDATGRQVSVARPPGVSIGWEPELTFTGLIIDGERPGSSPQLLRAGNIHAQLDLSALLDGRLQLHSLTVDNATIDVSPTNAALLSRMKTQGVKAPVAVGVNKVYLTKSAVTGIRELGADAGLGGLSALKDPSLRVATAVLTVTDGYTIEASVSSSGHAASLRLSLGSAASDTEVGFDGEFTIDGATVSIRGAAPHEQFPVGLDASVDIEHPQLTLSTRLTATIAEWRLADLRGTAATQAFSGTVRLPRNSPKPRLTGEIWFDQLQLQPTETRAMELPVVPVPVDLKLATGALNAGAFKLEGFTAQVTLDHGQIRVDNINGSAAGGTVTGSVLIKQGEDAPQIDANLTATSMNIGQIAALERVHDDVEGQFDAMVSLAVSGNNTADWQRSAQGKVVVELGKARARARALEIAVGGVHTLFDTLRSGEAEWMTLNCAVGNFNVEGGRATARLLVLDSQHATVSGEGSINIVDQTIDMRLTPYPKRTTLNVSVPVTVTGSLSNPSFSPDVGATTRRAGALVAGSLVFPPAILAAFIDLGVDNAGCLEGQWAKGADAASRLGEDAAKTMRSAETLLTEGANAAGKTLEGASDEVARTIKEAGAQAGRELDKAVQAIGKTLSSILGGASD